MNNVVRELMEELYFDESSARAILLRIDYPPARIPRFPAADTFWPEVLIRLENGIIADGVNALLKAASADHPGNEKLRDLLAEVSPPSGAGLAGGPVKVLALFSDPLTRSRIRLDREQRQLGEISRQAAGGAGIDIVLRQATRVTDILSAMLDEQPRILHFGGHGTSSGNLLFEDDAGGPALVDPAALAGAIAASMPEILDAVVLNCCFTAANADAFADVTRYVAGSVNQIPDDCALSFSSGFYVGLRSGQSVPDAYSSGVAQLKLQQYDTSGLHFVSFISAS